jgi:hypothetical protein
VNFLVENSSDAQTYNFSLFIVTLTSCNKFKLKTLDFDLITYSVETTYGINSVISKLMTFVENAETGQFLFLIVLILICFTCS